MFQQLNGFSRILVSGPQRSGTRFCSRAIGKELEYRVIDEHEFGNDDRDKLEKILRKEYSPVVVHCPALMYCLDEYSDMDTCIVVMIRNPTDIRRSMKRINWNYEQYEMGKYAGVWANAVPPTVKDIVDLKYYIWHERQKFLIANYQEIEYESLSANPLWLPEEARKHFGASQTY